MELVDVDVEMASNPVTVTTFRKMSTIECRRRSDNAYAKNVTATIVVKIHHLLRQLQCLVDKQRINLC